LRAETRFVGLDPWLLRLPCPFAARIAMIATPSPCRFNGAPNAIPTTAIQPYRATTLERAADPCLVLLPILNQRDIGQTLRRGFPMAKDNNKSKDQKSAEAEVESFADDLGPFVVAAETTRMAMVFADACEADNPIIFANDAFLELTGFTRKEVLGQNFNFFMAHVDDEEALALIRESFEGTSQTDFEIHYRRKDGTKFWATLFVSPVRDDDGDIIQYFASFVDLTSYKDERRGRTPTPRRCAKLWKAVCSRCPGRTTF
jgi:PAS domain S-box-containing protein